MAKTRVVVPGTIGRSVRIPSGTSAGATIGQNLMMPDGSPATAAALRAFLGIQPTKSTTIQSGAPAVSLWSLIQEVPSPVENVAALSDLQPNDAVQFDGTALTNVPTGPHYLVQTDAIHYWNLTDFVRGTNIIGVRVAGPSVVNLPHALPIEELIVVKDELGSGAVVVKIY